MTIERDKHTMGTGSSIANSRGSQNPLITHKFENFYSPQMQTSTHITRFSDFFITKQDVTTAPVSMASTAFLQRFPAKNGR